MHKVVTDNCDDTALIDMVRSMSESADVVAQPAAEVPQPGGQGSMLGHQQTFSPMVDSVSESADVVAQPAAEALRIFGNFLPSQPSLYPHNPISSD